MSDTVSYEDLIRKLDYNKETGWFTWKEVKSKKVKIGDRAGYEHHGYRYITIGDKTYSENRLAWFYTTGEWPKGIVDHKNLDRADNRWENLRDLFENPDSDNQHNTTIRLNNNLGFQGVTEHYGKYIARIRVNGVRYRFGPFDTPEEASRAYEEARTEFFGSRVHTDEDIENAITKRVERLRKQLNAEPRPYVDYLTRFHSSYEVSDTIPDGFDTPCWNWTNRFDKGTGYGWFKAKELCPHGMHAHRASWFIHNGPIEERTVFVRHKCHNRKCMNPDHLIIGTPKQNMEDCVKAGRINKGEDRPQSKLTEAIVREARQLRQQGMGWLKLAAKYNVAQNCIRLAVMGETWKHVDEPIPTYVGKAGNPGK